MFVDDRKDVSDFGGRCIFCLQVVHQCRIDLFFTEWNDNPFSRFNYMMKFLRYTVCEITR